MTPRETLLSATRWAVFYTSDFVRFGRGITVGAESIDAAYPGWSTGDLYIAADGFPIQDAQNRVTGDANPDWTASIRNSVTIGSNLTISGLIDIKRGGQTWNGTQGALKFFGASKDTEPYHGAGKQEVFGQTYFADQGVGGPGAGEEVTLNWASWFINGIGSFFTGPGSQTIEDSGFVKLRDISVTYSIRDRPWLVRAGFSSLDLSVSGRNLKTWTDYTGIDPESNLTNQTLGRGIEYFNNPQTRSFAFTFTLTR